MLELKKVSKTFENTTKETLQDIDLTVQEGEFVCIVGPSGCGKSTLLNLVAGLEKPTQGEILLSGVPIEGPGADRTVMFQDAALYPWRNVVENVMLGMEFLKLPLKERQRRAMYYLKMVHLSEFASYPIHQLSGGMRQRVSLARALCMDSKILLMDEPFSALDKQTTNLLRAELEQIWEEKKKTILFVTHSAEEAVYFADRIVVLSENPGTIKEIISCNLERPRQIDHPEFVRLRHELLELIRKEVMKFAKEEYDRD